MSFMRGQFLYDRLTSDKWSVLTPTRLNIENGRKGRYATPIPTTACCFNMTANGAIERSDSREPTANYNGHNLRNTVCFCL